MKHHKGAAATEGQDSAHHPQTAGESRSCGLRRAWLLAINYRLFLAERDEAAKSPKAPGVGVLAPRRGVGTKSGAEDGPGPVMGINSSFRVTRARFYSQGRKIEK